MTFPTASYSLGRLTDAVEECRRAIELDANRADAHIILGPVLFQLGRREEAAAECRKAIAINPKNATPHKNLGIVLLGIGRLEEAVAEIRKAIELDPKLKKTYAVIGVALQRLGRREEAFVAFRKAIEIDPNETEAHLWLGNLLIEMRRLDEAAFENRKAIKLDPKEANARGALGLTLLQQGRFSEAKQTTQDCLKLLPANHALRPRVIQQLQTCEQMIALDDKLTAILKGEVKPGDAAEQIRLALLCDSKKRYVVATRFFVDAFTAQPKLAEDLRARHRYNAACCASLAAAGQVEDSAKLTDKERTRLRQQAIDWLRADLALWSKQVESGKLAAFAAVCQTLQHWRKDKDLAGLRDADELAKLPEAERMTCQKLWADVAALEKKCDEKEKP